MINLKDTFNNQICVFADEKHAEEFIENHTRPQNIVKINIFYCDGGGFNGTNSKICFGTRNNLAVFTYQKKFTSNEMEYKAIWQTCFIAEKYDHIKTDSQLCVRQITGKYKCNFEHLKKYIEVIKTFIKEKNLTIEWINREQNIAGIHLDKLKNKLKRKNRGGINHAKKL